MGEMWFNGLFSNPGVKGFSVPQPQVASEGVAPFSLSGTVDLNHLVSLNHTNLSVVPQGVNPDQVNVHGLVRSAVAKDPHGLSLNPTTLAFLQNAPFDESQFGI